MTLVIFQITPFIFHTCSQLVAAHTLQIHHVYSTLKGHGNHFHVVLTRNTRGVFIGYKLTKLFQM